MRGRRKKARRSGGGAGDYAAAMDAALRLIGYRPRARREIEGRLREKGFGEEIIGTVADRLEEIGYLNDREFAIAWLKSRRGNRCRSRWVIKKELREKGLDGALIDETVDENYDDEGALRDARDLVRRKVERSRDEDPRKLKTRLQNMLLRRGFSYEFIGEALSGIIHPA